jgi:SAM-dependent methyltransferase
LTPGAHTDTLVLPTHTAGRREDGTRMDDRELRPGQVLAATCPLCGYASAHVLPFRYEFHGRLLQGVGCPQCDLARLFPMPSDEEIASLYAEEYFTTCTDEVGAHGKQAYMELATAGKADRRRAAARLDRLLCRQEGRRGRFCEVGCGPGFFLAEMRALGWEVRGLEISAFAARHAREVLGLQVDEGPLVPGRLPREAFDALLLGDVLEHLPRPREALTAVWCSLAPGGVVAVAVPSTRNLLSARLGMAIYRRRGRIKTLRLPPYHLFEYTPRSLRAMLERSGFRVELLRQSAVPLGKMGLRGSPVENVGKAVLQLFAHAGALVGNCGGDRLLALGVRSGDGAGDMPGGTTARKDRPGGR